MLILKINVAASCNQLVRDASMSILGCSGERCIPIVCRNICVAASFNQLLRDASMSILGRDEQRCGPRLIILSIDVTAGFNELLRTAACPFWAAMSSGVAPQGSWGSTLQRASINCFVTLACPFFAAL